MADACTCSGYLLDSGASSKTVCPKCSKPFFNARAYLHDQGGQPDRVASSAPTPFAAVFGRGKQKSCMWYDEQSRETYATQAGCKGRKLCPTCGFREHASKWSEHACLEIAGSWPQRPEMAGPSALPAPTPQHMATEPAFLPSPEGATAEEKAIEDLKQACTDYCISPDGPDADKEKQSVLLSEMEAKIQRKKQISTRGVDMDEVTRTWTPVAARATAPRMGRSLPNPGPCEILAVVCTEALMEHAAHEAEQVKDTNGVCVVEGASLQKLRDILVTRRPRHLHLILHSATKPLESLLIFDVDDADGGLLASNTDRLVRIVSVVRKQSNSRLQSISLNGCSMLKLADDLVKAGVPAVITWPDEVPDDVACNFGIELVKRIADPDKSLVEAFNLGILAAVDDAVVHEGMLAQPKYEWGSLFEGQHGPTELRKPCLRSTETSPSPKVQVSMPTHASPDQELPTAEPTLRGRPLEQVEGARIMVSYDDDGLRPWGGVVRQYSPTSGLLVRFDDVDSDASDKECWVDEDGEDEWEWEPAVGTTVDIVGGIYKGTTASILKMCEQKVWVGSPTLPPPGKVCIHKHNIAVATGSPASCCLTGMMSGLTI